MSVIDSMYGTFNMKPGSNIYNLQNFELTGSMGMRDKQATNGGGHIHIDVDSIRFEGSNTPIKANGLPLPENDYFREDIHGGSGGYIYLKTVNKN